jgi:DNA replication protein DnaC
MPPAQTIASSTLWSRRLGPCGGQSGPERRDLLEILDDRHGRASTIVTSQIPLSNIGTISSATGLGDAILDRLVH